MVGDKVFRDLTDHSGTFASECICLGRIHLLEQSCYLARIISPRGGNLYSRIAGFKLGRIIVAQKKKMVNNFCLLIENSESAVDIPWQFQRLEIALRHRLEQQNSLYKKIMF